MEEPLAERGIEVDHVTIYRWVQTFTPGLIDAARPARHASGDRWWIDETYVKVAGRWIYLYRAVDQHGQVIDVLVSTRRDGAAARGFFVRALRWGPPPVEVTTDRAPLYPRVVEEFMPAARHVSEPYANNRVETDHGRLKARLRPMRGLQRIRSARTISAGHAFVQNLRRGHYETTVDLPAHDRVRVAFDELALCLQRPPGPPGRFDVRQRSSTQHRLSSSSMTRRRTSDGSLKWLWSERLVQQAHQHRIPGPVIAASMSTSSEDYSLTQHSTNPER